MSLTGAQICISVFPRSLKGKFPLSQGLVFFLPSNLLSFQKLFVSFETGGFNCSKSDRSNAIVQNFLLESAIVQN